MASPNKKRPETWAKRFALNLKTTEDIRQKVEERAKNSGRSITLEVEQQLIKSFEIEEKEALNEEIKAEMRGTIAALEHRIALMEERDRSMWPDASARALGKSFALALAAVQQVTGQNWREDAAAAPIVGAVVHRLMAENTRAGGSLFAELFDKERIDFLRDGISKALGAGLREALPPLPDPQQDEPSAPTIRSATHADGTFTAQEDLKRPGSLFDDHDNAGLNLELVGGPDDGTPPEPEAPPPPPRRRARAKAGT